MNQKQIDSTHVFELPEDGDLVSVFLHRMSNPNASTILLCDPSLPAPIDFCIEHDLEYTPWAGSILSYILQSPPHILYTAPSWGAKNNYHDPYPTITTGTPSEILASIPNSSAAVRTFHGTTLTAAVELQPTAPADSTKRPIVAECALTASKIASHSDFTLCNFCVVNHENPVGYCDKCCAEIVEDLKAIIANPDWTRGFRKSTVNYLLNNPWSISMGIPANLLPPVEALYLTLPSAPLTLILIDCPWEYNSRHAGAETKARQEFLNRKGHGTKFSGGAEKHYTCPPYRRQKRINEGWEKDVDLTMLTPQELIEVAAYIKAASSPDAIMFCWVTGPLTWESHFAYDFMVACGFAPKTNAFNWFKLTDDVPLGYIYGPGFYTASSMETCVIAVKGKGLGSPAAKMLPSIIQFDDLDTPIPMTKGTKACSSKGIEASLPKPCIALCPRSNHSSKPLIHHLIDSMYPNQSATKLEIFARERVGNWAGCGSDTTGRDILEDLTDIINHLGLPLPGSTLPPPARKQRKKKTEPSPTTPPPTEPETIPIPFNDLGETQEALTSALSTTPTPPVATSTPTFAFASGPTPLCWCSKCECGAPSVPYGPNCVSPQACLNCGEKN